MFILCRLQLLIKKNMTDTTQLLFEQRRKMAIEILSKLTFQERSEFVLSFRTEKSNGTTMIQSSVEVLQAVDQNKTDSNLRHN